jgi:hypothetical protein
MGKLTQNMSARDKTRWLGLGAGGLCMVIGAFYPVSFEVLGKRVTDNGFFLVGGVVMLLTFGVVQLVKAVKGQGEK